MSFLIPENLDPFSLIRIPGFPFSLPLWMDAPSSRSPRASTLLAARWVPLTRRAFSSRSHLPNCALVWKGRSEEWREGQPLNPGHAFSHAFSFGGLDLNKLKLPFPQLVAQEHHLLRWGWLLCADTHSPLCPLSLPPVPPSHHHTLLLWISTLPPSPHACLCVSVHARVATKCVVWLCIYLIYINNLLSASLFNFLPSALCFWVLSMLKHWYLVHSFYLPQSHLDRRSPLSSLLGAGAQGGQHLGRVMREGRSLLRERTARMRDWVCHQQGAIRRKILKLQQARLRSPVRGKTSWHPGSLNSGLDGSRNGPLSHCL